MNLFITLFASVSAVISLAIYYYNYKIVKQFREEEELAATKMVIKEGVPGAFMALSIASLFFSLGSFLGATTIIAEISLFDYFSELGVLTMLSGLLVFMKRISDAVEERSEEDS